MRSFAQFSAECWQDRTDIFLTSARPLPTGTRRQFVQQGVAEGGQRTVHSVICQRLLKELHDF